MTSIIAAKWIIHVFFLNSFVTPQDRLYLIHEAKKVI